MIKLIVRLLWTIKSWWLYRVLKRNNETPQLTLTFREREPVDNYNKANSNSVMHRANLSGYIKLSDTNDIR